MTNTPDPWESNFGRSHGRPSGHYSHTTRSATANPAQQKHQRDPRRTMLDQELMVETPSAVQMAIIAILISFAVSAYVTIASIDHIEKTLASMPGGQSIIVIIQKYGWIAWGLLAADIITSGILLPGCARGKPKSRRGLFWVGFLEALFNLPGVPQYLGEAPPLAFAILGQTILQCGAVLMLYSGDAAIWFRQFQTRQEQLGFGREKP